MRKRLETNSLLHNCCWGREIEVQREILILYVVVGSEE